MNQQGTYLGQHRFPTTKSGLISQVVEIPGETKQLTIEQGNMTQWAAGQLAPYVDKLIVCDPRHNQLVSSGICKNDRVDTMALCELLRMAALKPLYCDAAMGKRRLFYYQMKEYERITKHMTNAKRQLQAGLRHWGYNLKPTKTDYKKQTGLLEAVDQPQLKIELEAKMKRIRFLQQQKNQQFQRIEQTGEDFWEISEFQQMAGVGPVNSHTISAYMQTPHRFGHKGQLIKFSQLAVRKRSSDGRKLGHEKLSKSGHSSLKNASYMTWSNAVGGDNEVNAFYQASLAECGSKTNARLNTQRKILISLWSLWKHKSPYDPNKFYSSK
jgi:hypothetical protein